MLYYIITAELAKSNGLDSYRIGDDEMGYLVNRGDLVAVDIDACIENGTIREVSVTEGKEVVKSFNSKQS